MVVPGDVNSTLAGALAAVKLGIPVCHVESGLRSFDRSMPEEHNRRVTDHLSTLLLTHCREANDNLAREGIDHGGVQLVGNTMIDTLRSNVRSARQLRTWADYGVRPGRYVLVTLHRPALVDVPDLLEHTMACLEGLAEEIPVIFPVHPRTRERLVALGTYEGRVRLVNPQSYGRFLCLEAEAAAVITDSGGVQEETTALGVPCFTLRDNTERHVTVTHGTNTVLGLDPTRLLEVPERLREPRMRARPPLWDGRAGIRAAVEIEKALGLQPSGRRRRVAATERRLRRDGRLRQSPAPAEGGDTGRPGVAARVRPHDNPVVRKLAILCAAAAIVGIGSRRSRPAFEGPVTWTPDALYYQARLLEIRGADHDAAMAKTFEGPLSAELRARDPHHTGNPTWVAYNEPFYERRLAVPLAGAGLYPLEGDRSLLDISLAGYVAALLAVFGFLLLRFRLAIAVAVTLATIFLPPLVEHSSFPLTDSWGLALETSAFAAVILTLDRGRRWLPLWIGVILLLSFTRDSTWIPILAIGWCAWRQRSRDALWLFGTGVVAALPALLFFQVPVRSLLALLVNDSDIPSDTSWTFIVGHYPGAALELIRANGGFIRDSEWYAALYLVGGVVLLLALAVRGHYRRSTTTSLMTAGAVLSLLYVFAAPVFSAFRLELVFVPMAAYGIALATQRRTGTADRHRRRGAAAGLAAFEAVDTRGARPSHPRPTYRSGRSGLTFGVVAPMAVTRDKEACPARRRTNVIVRKKVAHTQRLWRRLALWQRCAFVASAVVVMLVQLGGSSAAVSAVSSDQVGQWSAPVAWPLVAVHMSLEPTGLVFMLDGFDAGANSERLWDPRPERSLPFPTVEICSAPVTFSSPTVARFWSEDTSTRTRASLTQRSSTRLRTLTSGGRTCPSDGGIRP